MGTTWAISGVDLHLELKGSRVRAALESALREAVLDGRLKAGTRLPSSRALAADLGIARNTVGEAYSQLAAEGWLTARQGSGTRVADRASRVAPHALARARTASAKTLRYDLTPGTPDLSAFPRTAWIAAARRALNVAPNDALGYSDPRGRPELRDALAEYLARARGVRCGPERIVVTSGFAQAFRLLTDVLVARGATRLALEQDVEPTTGAVAAASALTVRRIAVDDEGAAVGELDNADAVVLTAAHQFPTGAPLSRRRRLEVVEWASRTGGLIVEDDYDGEFRYDRHPLGSLQSLDPEHVVYAGTTSKTLAPGLRIGWLALPQGLIEEVTQAKAVADRQGGVIDQLTLAELIVSGGYDRHVRRCRIGYRRRRDRLLAALERRVPDVRVSGIAAGLHALVQLPGGISEADVIERAASRGLALDGLSSYAEGARAGPQALVVGYAKPPLHAYTTALARLTAALTSRPALRQSR